MKQEETKTVNICKNLTDAAAFIAVVCAAFVLFVAKESFKPSGDTTSFLQVEANVSYLKIAGICLLSGLVCVFTRRYPTLGLAFSFLPFCITFSLFKGNVLTGRPVLYIVLTLVHAVGGIIYFAQWFASRGNELKNSAFSLGASYVAAGVSVAVWLGARFLLDVKAEEEVGLAFYAIIAAGLASAAAGVVWCKKAEKLGDKAPALFWNSVSAGCACVIVLMLRIILKQFGV